jgi:hypothetical protein
VEPSEFEYIIPVTVVREKTDKGRSYHLVKMTNEAIREWKSAQARYITHKQEFYNPQDRNDREEMKVSEQIQKEVHENWRIENPSE